MSKPVKVILGVASLWPLLYMLIFICYWLYMVLWITSHPEGGGGAPGGIALLFIVHGITMVWLLALLAIYIYDVFNNSRVDKDKKALWAVVLFLGNVIAMPIYWYLYIWAEDSRLHQLADRQQ